MRKKHMLVLVIVAVLIWIFVPRLLQTPGDGATDRSGGGKSADQMGDISAGAGYQLDLSDLGSVSASGRQVCRSGEPARRGCLLLPEEVIELVADVSGNGDVVAVGLGQAYVIKLGRTLKQVFAVPAVPAAFDRIVIDKSLNMLYWYRRGRFRARYQVATGRESHYTPEGIFSVVTKIADPRGPDNAKPQLGVRWLGLSVPTAADKRGSPGDAQTPDERAPRGEKYGIHGTDEPTSIGTHASGGCVRMRNADILALYEQVSIGTVVEIRG